MTICKQMPLVGLVRADRKAAVIQITAGYNRGMQRHPLTRNGFNLGADELQLHRTTPCTTPVSWKQETEATTGTSSPQLEHCCCHIHPFMTTVYPSSKTIKSCNATPSRCLTTTNINPYPTIPRIPVRGPTFQAMLLHQPMACTQWTVPVLSHTRSPGRWMNR